MDDVGINGAETPRLLIPRILTPNLVLESDRNGQIGAETLLFQNEMCRYRIEVVK